MIRIKEHSGRGDIYESDADRLDTKRKWRSVLGEDIRRTALPSDIRLLPNLNRDAAAKLQTPALLRAEILRARNEVL